MRVLNLASLYFFRFSFHNCINCLFNCDDLLFFYFFIPQFKCLKIIFFILSSSFPGILRSNLIAFLSFSCYLNWLERCTSIAKVRVPISARPEFFQPFFSQLLEVAYYSFQIKLSTFFRLDRFEQLKVSTELFITAIHVNYHFIF